MVRWIQLTILKLLNKISFNTGIYWVVIRAKIYDMYSLNRIVKIVRCCRLHHIIQEWKCILSMINGILYYSIDSVRLPKNPITIWNICIFCQLSFLTFSIKKESKQIPFLVSSYHLYWCNWGESISICSYVIFYK